MGLKRIYQLARLGFVKGINKTKPPNMMFGGFCLVRVVIQHLREKPHFIGVLATKEQCLSLEIE